MYRPYSDMANYLNNVIYTKFYQFCSLSILLSSLVSCIVPDCYFTLFLPLWNMTSNLLSYTTITSLRRMNHLLECPSPWGYLIFYAYD